MKISLPYSKHRRYLTGIDWTIAALSDLCRRHTGGTNSFQIVLHLHGPFDDTRFHDGIRSLVREFPLLGGTPSRDWTLCPYWRFAAPNTPIPLVLESHPLTEPELGPVLAAAANTPFPDNHTHLAFRVFHLADDRHTLAVQFDHRLFDAAGAEAFLDLLHRHLTGEDCRARIAAVSLREPAHLCDWMKKFEAGKQLIRLLRRFAETTLVILPRPSPLKGRPIHFSVLEFSAADSRAIAERADREAGFLMFMPYALASALGALHPLFARRAPAGHDYIISVSTDLRTPDSAAADLFFNHLSFLFFQIPAAVADDRAAVLSALRTQMYDQIKSQFPKALYESGMLMRLAPPALLSRIMLKPLRGEFASFGFTCVGKAGYPSTRFMEATIDNLIHMPLVPVPPGIGLFVNHFGPKINVVLSVTEGMLDDTDIAHLRAALQRLL